LETIKIVMMKDLRVYMNPLDTAEPSERKVFYSRRGEGPYYRWRYEVELGQWCGSRVPSSDRSLKELCVARWKVVPTALQASLDEYYIE
jgi:hypothetical protein